VNLSQTVVLAVRSLLRNRLRSFLTALGIIIGVGAVVAMTSIGAGASARVEKMFEDMGSNMLIVRSGSSQSGGMRGGANSQLTITWDDMDAIAREVPSATHIAPLLSGGYQTMAAGQNWATSVQGTTPDYFSIRNWPIESGAQISDLDLEAGAKVAVVGQTVVQNLFGPFTDPVGEVIRINQVPFEIIGVLSAKGQSPFGTDNDDVVFVPVTTFRAKLQGGLQQFIRGMLFVGAASQSGTVVAQKEIEELLRARHRIREGEQDDFAVRNLSEFASAQQEGAKTMTALLAGIAFVSLVVGGIGIMNIMLVSVTERTREIGLRMAVGAKPRSILMQFLVEAVVLSCIGGVVGVGAGLGSAYWLVSKFDWPMLVQVDVVIVAVIFSALVGVCFGLYPAFQASRLDPITALRYE
jgi:putative ABC transport system permease protein